MKNEIAILRQRLLYSPAGGSADKLLIALREVMPLTRLLGEQMLMAGEKVRVIVVGQERGDMRNLARQVLSAEARAIEVDLS